ncbi:flagellar basal body rod protein FlgC [Congregibacter litoralis]|uniref:Flagellar basal-body rod protein FlgC n=1 Tax=Congregibacter litoralis KT71 TaxID=314285 RepID=A4A617_9GAMM|nr:flagellar basal body rod protein FlgC [Congregibacter litoralis]EAQ98464.1 flagellar basal-body rod protein FlgC [Congregibacter litoralis KT71]
MSLFDAISVAATSLDAQSTRLNTISSNLANANAVSSSAEETYRAQYPVFETMLNELSSANGMDAVAGVRVSGITQSDLPAVKEYVPTHPMADDEGFIYRPAINSVEEMANMMEASRSYQDSIEAMNTAKQLILRTLTLGR